MVGECGRVWRRWWKEEVLYLHKTIGVVMVKLRDGKDVLLFKVEVLKTGNNEMKDTFFTGIDIGKGQIAVVNVELMVGSKPIEDASEWSPQAEEDPKLSDGVVGGGSPAGRVGLEMMEQVWVEVLLKVWHSSQTLAEVEA